MLFHSFLSASSPWSCSVGISPPFISEDCNHTYFKSISCYRHIFVSLGLINLLLISYETCFGIFVWKLILNWSSLCLWVHFPTLGLPTVTTVFQGSPPSLLGFWVTRGLLQWPWAGVIWLKRHRCLCWSLSPLAITLGHRRNVWAPFVDGSGLPRLDPVLGYMETVFCSLCLAGFSSQSIYIFFEGGYVLEYVYTLLVVSVILELERRRAVWAHVAVLMEGNLPCPPTQQQAHTEHGSPWRLSCCLN